METTTKQKAAKQSAKNTTKTKAKAAKPREVKPKVVKPKAPPKPKLSAEQLQARRSAAARKAALALWEQRRSDPNRAPSKKQMREQFSRLATSQLSVDHYADRPNPKLSWAAAILKRENSSALQRREAAHIVSEAHGPRESPWSKLPPEERSEIARRGGQRRWQIWREEQALLAGKTPQNESGHENA